MGKTLGKGGCRGGGGDEPTVSGSRCDLCSWDEGGGGGKRLTVIGVAKRKHGQVRSCKSSSHWPFQGE